jgi:hypothetical protein
MTKWIETTSSQTIITLFLYFILSNFLSEKSHQIEEFTEECLKQILNLYSTHKLN